MRKNISENYARENGKELLNVRLFRSLSESVCSNFSFLKVSRLGLTGFRAISFRILGQIQCYRVAVNCFRRHAGVSGSGTFLSQWKESRLKMDIHLPSLFCEYHHFIFQKEHCRFCLFRPPKPALLLFYFRGWGGYSGYWRAPLNMFTSTSIFSYQVEATMSKRNN